MKTPRSVFVLALLASISVAQTSPDTDLRVTERASEDAFFMSPKMVEMNDRLAKVVEARLGVVKAKKFMDGLKGVERGAYEAGYGDATIFQLTKKIAEIEELRRRVRNCGKGERDVQ